MAKRVIVRINTRNGERFFDIDGVEGNSCEEITKALAERNEIVKQELKAEYSYQDSLPEYISE